MRSGYRRLRQARISFPAAVLLALFVLLASEYGYWRSSGLGTDLNAAIEARLQVQRLLRLMLDAETGQRGYLITGESAYLHPYREAAVQIDEVLRSMRERYLNTPALARPFAELERHVEGKRAEMQTTVALRSAGDEGWRAIVENDRGLRHMERIRELGGQLAQHEWDQIAAFQRSLSRTLMTARTAIATMVAMALLAMALYLRESNRNARLQEQHRIRLQGERNSLEHQVQQRTRRLRRLASYLQNVREDERARLARELHDELGALLVAAKLDLARLKSRLASADPFVVERIAHLGEALNSGISLKRRIIEDLHPSSLYKLGLVAALETLVREFSARTGAVVDSDLSAVDLSDERQLTCYRLVQEALTNIAKYACATRVTLRLAPLNDAACIEVGDNGVGFDPASIPASSHGLEGMQYRVESQGGSFSIESAQAKGTRIRALLPAGDAALSGGADGDS